jgi:hypothetical protein
VDYSRSTGRQDECQFSRKKPAARLSERPSHLILAYDVNPEHVLGNARKIAHFASTVSRDRHYLSLFRGPGDTSSDSTQVVNGYQKLGHAKK